MDDQPKTQTAKKAPEPVEAIHLIILNAAGLPGSLILALSEQPQLRAISLINALGLIVFDIWWLRTNQLAEKAKSSK